MLQTKPSFCKTPEQPKHQCRGLWTIFFKWDTQNKNVLYVYLRYRYIPYVMQASILRQSLCEWGEAIWSICSSSFFYLEIWVTLPPYLLGYYDSTSSKLFWGAPILWVWGQIYIRAQVDQINVQIPSMCSYHSRMWSSQFIAR